MEQPTGRRLQDWTNRYLFATSVDSLTPYQQQQYFTEYEEDTKPDVDEEPKEPITALQAAWNVTNAIQGMFIVGLPFAVKVGGWWTIVALCGVAYLCYCTGVLLIECLYEGGTKVRRSYKEVADAYIPGTGRLVLVAQLTELFSTCIIYIVIAGDLLQGCFPSIDKTAWMMLVATSLLACSFLDSLQVVSNLSLINAISHLIVNAILVFYCFAQISNWVWSEVSLFPDPRIVPTIFGVVIFGYTSHIFLPSLEASMKDPKDFKSMLKWSHVVAAVFKSMFGLLGFLTFGELTQNEFSNSLPNQSFKILINLVLVVKALFSYPLPYFAAIHLIRENFFQGTQKTWFSSCYGVGNTLREWALCLRIIMLLFTLFVALSVPYLIELMGLIGNITGTMLSFIWPALFHLKIKGSSCGERQKRFDYFIIISGAVVMFIGIYYSSIELANAIKYSEENMK